MPKLRRTSLAVLLCCFLLLSPRPARADSLKSIAVEIIVGTIAVTAAITVGVVLLVRHHPSLKGCAASGPDGLQLTDSEGQTYALSGDVAELKPGDRIRVSGKKLKGAADSRKFIVEKSKDYGPCPAAIRP